MASIVNKQQFVSYFNSKESNQKITSIQKFLEKNALGFVTFTDDKQILANLQHRLDWSLSPQQSLSTDIVLRQIEMRTAIRNEHNIANWYLLFVVLVKKKQFGTVAKLWATWILFEKHLKQTNQI